MVFTDRKARFWTACAVSVFALGAFALRVALSYQAVFGGDGISFIETDAYYHMRLVDALVRNFPARIWFDPYLRHPGGEATNVGPLFDWIIASVALVLGSGHPGERLIDVVGAFTPPVIGALVVVPAYVIGRELFSRRAGLWAAFIVGVLPGEILKRSLLGYTDHHCAEVLLSSVTMMCVVLAVTPSRTPTRRAVFAVLGGVSLGCYLLTWSGGALLVAVLLAWALTQIAADRLRRRDSSSVVLTMVILFTVSTGIVIPWSHVAGFDVQILAMTSGLAAVALMAVVARITERAVRGRLTFVTVLIAAVFGSVLAVAWIVPDGATAAWSQLRRFSLDRSVVLASEALPLMRSQERAPFPLWHQFTTSLFLAAVGLISLVPRCARDLPPPLMLVMAWTGAMALATVGQVRFAYYLGLNVALCAACGCTVIQRLLEPPASLRSPGASALRTLAVTGGLCVALMLPTVKRYRVLGAEVSGPTTSWIDALQWLRSNSPEPFGDADRYYGTTPPADAGESRYGVLASWDMGYFIARIAHRVPVANPRQSGARESAEFLLAQSDAEAAAIADRIGARYVAIDWLLQPRVVSGGVILTGYLQNLALTVERPITTYVTLAYRSTAAGRVPVLLYSPTYYRTMMSRLYRNSLVSRGREACWVVALEERVEGSRRFLEIQREVKFPDYDAAERSARTSGNPDARIFGEDPLTSCGEAAPVQAFTRVYGSIERERGNGPAIVQLFQRRSSSH